MAVLTLSGCASSGSTANTIKDSAAGAATPASENVPALDPAGWTASVYKQLTDTISASTGQGKVVVFDFDNTTQARDIGEAVLAQVQKTNAIDASALSPAVFPPFTAADGTPMQISRGVYEYYTAVLDSGAESDPFREYSSLPMPATAFYGRTIADFLAQTAAVYDGGSGAKDLASGTESKILAAGRPFIYPQMADLYGNLRANGYDVWVVSAGVAWAVRWMVQNALNPAIVAKYGPQAALPLDRVLAITTLMKDRVSGTLVSDYQLVHQAPDRAYIDLDPARMRQLEILALPDGLSSWRGGKSGAIDNVITRDEVFMVAGDSMGDVEMLSRAPNRLLVARMNKPDLAEGYAREIEAAPEANWMIQPTINSAPVGFVATSCEMATKTAGNSAVATASDKSLRVLDDTGRLGSFHDC